MLYGVIAEDGYILKAVPVLISRIVNTGDDAPECRLMNGKDDFIANFWKWVKEFQFRYPQMHKVMAVCDADQESPDQVVAVLIDRARRRLAGLPFPLVFHVIKRELETWWVADPSSISAATGVNIPFAGGYVEDGVPQPKEYIVGYLAAQRIPYTRTVAEAAARNLDFETVASRCPSFVVFRQHVVNGEATVRDVGLLDVPRF